MRNDKGSFQWECQVCFSLSFFHLALRVSLLILAWRGLELSLITKSYNCLTSFLDCESRITLRICVKIKGCIPSLLPFPLRPQEGVSKDTSLRCLWNSSIDWEQTREGTRGLWQRSPDNPHWNILVPFTGKVNNSQLFLFLFFFSFLKEIKCKRYVSTALKLRFRRVFQCYDSHSNCNSTSLHILLQGIKINITLYTAEYITTALRNTVAIWEQH